MAILPVQEPAGVIVDAATSASVTFVSNVTAGNRIVVGAGRLSASAFVAGDCTQSAGTATLGTITLDQQSNNATSGANAAGTWSAPVTGTGTCTLRVTGAAGSYFVMAVGEYSGLDTTLLDGTPAGTASNTATSPATSGNVTSTGDALFFEVVAIDSDNGAVGQVTGNSFTDLKSSTNGSADLVGTIARRIVTGAATTGGTWTWNTTTGRGYSAVCVAYKVAGGGGGSSPSTGFWPRPMTRNVPTDARYRAMRTLAAYASDLPVSTPMTPCPLCICTTTVFGTPFASGVC